MENYNLVMIEKSYAIATDSRPSSGIFVSLSSYVSDFCCLMTTRLAISAYKSIILSPFKDISEMTVMSENRFI